MLRDLPECPAAMSQRGTITGAKVAHDLGRNGAGPGSPHNLENLVARLRLSRAIEKPYGDREPGSCSGAPRQAPPTIWKSSGSVDALFELITVWG